MRTISQSQGKMILNRDFFILILILPFILSWFHSPLFSAPGFKQWQSIEQPDGTKIKVLNKGDEWANWLETEEGYPVILNKESLYFEYAKIDSTKGLVPSSLIVGKDQPQGIKKITSSDLETLKTIKTRGAPSFFAPQFSAQAAVSVEPTLGTHKILAILVNFKNRSLTTTEADWEEKFFGATNSVKKYFKEVSYNQLTMTPAEESNGTANNGIVVVTLSYDHPNTGSTIDEPNQQLTKDAILAADSYVNFASFDTNNDGYLSTDELHVVIIPAGYERAYSLTTPSVWGHRWSIFFIDPPVVDGTTVAGFSSGYTQFGELHYSHQATIGIICHELSHDLGLPDLYDTDSSNGSSAGIGDWDIMASGSWNGILYAGDSPSHYSAWSKSYLGWVTPTQIKNFITGASFPQVETSEDSDRGIKQLLSNPNGPEMFGSGEYFLIENRQKTGYDQALPSSGLLIWHIDESQSGNGNQARKLVDLVEADGLNQLDTGASYGDSGDPYPGSSGNKTFNNSSNPSSKFYNGANSNISISNISNSSAAMTADISLPIPTISLNKNSLSFTAAYASNSSDPQIFTIANTGSENSTLNWTGKQSASWLTLSSNSGSMAKNDQNQITVSVKPFGLAVGTHKTTVVISDSNSSNSEVSISVSLTIQDITPVVGAPSMPQDQGTYTNSTSIVFSWESGAAQDLETGIAGYYLQVGNSPGGANLFDGDVGNVFSKTVTGAKEGETYYARVRAKNGAGLYGSYSDNSNGIKIDLTAPEKPSSIISKTHPNSTTSYPEPKPEFKVSGPEDSSGVSGYYWKVDSLPDSVPSQSDNFSSDGTCKESNPIADNTWYFHVIAKDGAGNIGTQAAHYKFIVRSLIDIANKNIFATADGVEVEIPPDALTNSTQIMIEEKTNAPPLQNDPKIKGTGIMREITLTDGTKKFKKEVTINLPYNDSDVSNLNEHLLRLFYYDESSGLWVLVPNSSVDRTNKRVIGKVDHLTLFAIMEYAADITSDIMVYPNPFRPKNIEHANNGIIFRGLPVYSEIKIYTLSGDLVKQLKDEDGDGRVKWNAQTESDQKVESGIYFALVKESGKTKTVKIAIQR
ncbi:MAG: M6 family metalloprotease domain-containing protein [Elusimicrobia bacterium]|nr:M6 family metalloprotease domain-containing protein [Elusimicrobiota bacterium]